MPVGPHGLSSSKRASDQRDSKIVFTLGFLATLSAVGVVRAENANDRLIIVNGNSGHEIYDGATFSSASCVDTSSNTINTAIASGAAICAAGKPASLAGHNICGRRRMRAWQFIFVAATLPAAAEKRVALLIGNGAYAALKTDIDVEDEAGRSRPRAAIARSGERLKPMILDACRKNPFARLSSKAVVSELLRPEERRSLGRTRPRAAGAEDEQHAGSLCDEGGRRPGRTATLIRHEPPKKISPRPKTSAVLSGLPALFSFAGPRTERGWQSPARRSRGARRDSAINGGFLASTGCDP